MSSVALKVEVKLALEVTAKTEPAGGDFTAYSAEVYKVSRDFKIAEIADDRLGGSDGWNQYLAGMRSGDVMLGVRGDSQTDAAKITRFLETNAGKNMWMVWRPEGPGTDLIYKARVLPLSIPSPSGEVGSHATQFDITLKVNGLAPVVSYDGGLNWSKIAAA